jgi:hypothetical protein
VWDSKPVTIIISILCIRACSGLQLKGKVGWPTAPQRWQSPPVSWPQGSHREATTRTVPQQQGSWFLTLCHTPTPEEGPPGQRRRRGRRQQWRPAAPPSRHPGCHEKPARTIEPSIARQHRSHDDGRKVAGGRVPMHSNPHTKSAMRTQHTPGTHSGITPRARNSRPRP